MIGIYDTEITLCFACSAFRLVLSVELNISHDEIVEVTVSPEFTIGKVHVFTIILFVSQHYVCSKLFCVLSSFQDTSHAVVTGRVIAANGRDLASMADLLEMKVRQLTSLLNLISKILSFVQLKVLIV